MKHFAGHFLLSAFLLFSSNVVAVENINIIPKPLSVAVQEGAFALSAKTSINLLSADAKLKLSVDFFNDLLKKTFSKGLKVGESKNLKSNAINVNVNSLLGDEEYTLAVDNKQITIEGGSPKAVFYAFQTLRQLLPVSIEKGAKMKLISIPAVVIKDKPDFAYRGGMLDVCRHFFTVAEVKKYIDILSLHKMNTFHWHLTDDQGWRIEIKKYPKLTEVGSIRNQTKVGNYSDEKAGYDNTPYGGFYTQKQIKEIVKYASDKFITIIPEIEMPGHGVAALTSYPYLGCVGKNYKLRETWGVSEEVYCPGKETTFQFIEDVLTEVMNLFPSEYIHIGGDECPKGEWEKCPLCQKRIKDEGLKNELELQSYLVLRVEKFVNSKGRKIIGWDEILEGGLSKTATVMSWRGSKGGIEAAKRGNHVIMAPNTYCYLDYYQTGDLKNEPLGIGGNLPIEKVYELNPYQDLNAEECKYIVGVQGNLWTEYIATFDHAEYMILPRLAAISEVGWALNRKDYPDFWQRMQSMMRRYDALGYRSAKHMLKNKPKVVCTPAQNSMPIDNL
ncbi:MAG: beta-N-acetylhexosaminidase [Bacteroides sp.]